MAVFHNGSGINPGSGNPFGSGGNPYGSSGNPYGGGGNPFGGSGNSFGGGSFGGGSWNPQMSGRNYTQKRETKFAFVLLFASLIGAVIFFLIGEFIYKTLIVNINSIVFMGIYFAVLGLVLAVCLLIAARICKFEFSVKSIIVSGICILLLFILGMFFEFLYELNFTEAVIVKDRYVFAIDNSASMEQNDPGQKRIEAVKQLLEDKEADTEFAVYSFAQEIQCIREMGTVSEGFGDLTLVPSGGTPIVGVLTQIQEDMESGALPYEEGTQIILLTDGYATDSGLFNYRINGVLNDLKKLKVSVSTVGLGSVDENFLNNISGKTGGLSVTTDNVNELSSAVASAVRTVRADRNLLSARAQAGLNWLYGIMRIVFIAILGIICIGIKVTMTDESVNAPLLIVSSIIGSCMGAVVIEVGLNLFLTELLARLLLVILIYLTITTIERIINLLSGIGSLSRL